MYRSKGTKLTQTFVAAKAYPYGKIVVIEIVTVVDLVTASVTMMVMVIYTRVGTCLLPVRWTLLQRSLMRRLRSTGVGLNVTLLFGSPAMGVAAVRRDVSWEEAREADMEKALKR